MRASCNGRHRCQTEASKAILSSTSCPDPQDCSRDGDHRWTIDCPAATLDPAKTPSSLPTEEGAALRTGLHKNTDPPETRRQCGFLRKPLEGDDVVIVVRKCCVNVGTVHDPSDARLSHDDTLKTSVCFDGPSHTFYKRCKTIALLQSTHKQRALKPKCQQTTVKARTIDGVTKTIIYMAPPSCTPERDPLNPMAYEKKTRSVTDLTALTLCRGTVPTCR